jgi:hypothetical protein
MSEPTMIPIIELCSYHQIDAAFLDSLQKYGLIELINSNGDRYLPADEVLVVEKLVRLHFDLHINLEGLDVILYLLQRQEDLKKEISDLQKRLSFYELQQRQD